MTEELKKRRWSASKIERWVLSKRKDVEKVARRRAADREIASAEIEEWLAFIGRLFETTEAASFGVMRHWGDRRIKIKETMTISNAALSGERLLGLPESCLLSVTRS